MSSKDLPPVKFTTISKGDGVQVWRGPPSDIEKEEGYQNTDGSAVHFSRDGTRLAITTSTGVSVTDTASGEVVAEIERTKIFAVQFSPLATYLLTWERWNKDKHTESGEGNLRVYYTATGELITQYKHKSNNRDAWPFVQWSDDELIAARMVQNEVLFFDGTNVASEAIDTLEFEGIGAFALSRGDPPYKLAAFVPERKGSPAAVCVYHYPNIGRSQAVASKSFFKAGSVSMEWNKAGTALIIKTSTDHDQTGKSYYGETSLYYMSANGDVSCKVPLPKEGPVHDVGWNPNGKEFVVVHGFTPAKAILFDYKCRPKFDFGSASRNTVVWSPHGRFLVIAGFGNLAGDMDFWDRQKEELMGTARASDAHSFHWSPDSRHCITATTFPRLRVDNGFQIWKHNGDLVHEESFDELYSVQFRPCAPGIYPNLKPEAKQQQSNGGGGGASSGSSASSKSANAQPSAQPYRPPGARGSNWSSSFMKRKEDNDAPKKITGSVAKSNSAGGGGGNGSRTNTIPGAAPVGGEKLSRTALKNKRKRERKKALREAQKAREDLQETIKSKGGAGSSSSSSSSSTGSGSGKEDDVDEVELLDSVDACAKRLKNLHKKMRQIAALKQRMDEGEVLEDDQLSKVQRETEVTSLIDRIEAKKAQLEG